MIQLRPTTPPAKMTEEDFQSLQASIGQYLALSFKYSKECIKKHEAAMEASKALKTERCRAIAAEELQRTASDRIQALKQEEELLHSLQQNLMGLRSGGMVLDWSVDAELDCKGSLAKIYRQRDIATLTKQAADLEYQDAQEAAQKAQEKLYKIFKECGDLGAQMERLKQDIALYQVCKEEAMSQLQRQVSPEVQLEYHVG
ncbi:hypothetical protein LCI18_010727 [Fusarium solani-melongenae]|uniref:Uncharacterized protein n=1 Tax=Fusarium solani subsp. cucurbitae TaxID=2747967 RepID=A0ACD3ZFP5_FUSSC|nr:hypothetical protein LCI18_010727 [Fusarium solani-melongenae]